LPEVDEEEEEDGGLGIRKDGGGFSKEKEVVEKNGRERERRLR